MINSAELKDAKQGYRYKAKYGLSTADVRNMLSSQMNLCANRACGKELFLDTNDFKNKAYVDHCHETGSVRGILCSPCNTALGILDKKNMILGLTEYLNNNLSTGKE